MAVWINQGVIYYMLLVYLLAVLEIKGLHGTSIFVAVNGEDRRNCGRGQDTPCQSLQHAVNQAEDGDIILIDATSTRNNPTWACAGEVVLLNVSVTITGFNGRPVIGCERDSGRMLMFNLTYGVENTSYVFQFKNIHFQSVLLNVDNPYDNTSVIIHDAEFYDSKWVSPPTNPVIHFEAYNMDWIGSMDDNCTGSNCQPTAVIDMKGVFLHVDIQSSKFLHTKIAITSGTHVQFLIAGCLFSNVANIRSSHGDVYLTVGNALIYSNVVVRDTVFERQVYYDPIQSIMNLYLAALLVRSVHPTKGETGNGVVLVENCKFKNNERGLTFIGPFSRTTVLNCTFTGNIAMHAGAAILYLTDPSTPSFVTNCSFYNNEAGSFKPQSIVNYENSFQIIGDEVRIHSNCCKGIISFVGKGGAIRIQRGNLTLKDCNFVNNTARLLGGAIFVDRESSMYVENVFFENSPISRHAMQGDIFYSNGLVQIKSATLMILTAMNHMTLVRHSGDHWSIEVNDVAIQCPIGYRLRVTNTSAYGVTPVGLRRSYKLDQLSYFCESCPRHKYSLDYGYLNYSLSYNTFAYFTLLIDGTEPETAYTGTYHYQDIECQQCPYGGKCQQGITAVANFWGYIYENQVRFQHCPKGYCCLDKDCESYSTCATHRTGILCGSCDVGYSEALFSSQCVRDDNCDSTWLWPLALSSGFLYFLFLLFQKDVRDLMFINTVSLQDIHFPWRKKEMDFHMNSLSRNDSETIAYRNNYGIVRPLKEEDEEVETILENNVTDNGIENNNRVNHKKDDDEDNGDNKEDEAPVDAGASFLIILFYYFQDAQLLHIKTVFAEAENKTRDMFKQILSGLFKFRVEIFQFMDKFCFLNGLTPTNKLFIKVILVPFVLFLFGLMYLVYRCIMGLKGGYRKPPRHLNGVGHKLAYYKHPGLEEAIIETQNGNIYSNFTDYQRPKATTEEVVNESEANNTATPPTKTFSSKLATGFVLSLLFTYQKLATTSFTLLNCVPVGGEMVLYIQGTVTCYTMWQYGVMAYTASCIVPFCLVLLIGPGLLKDDIISLPQFFCACLLPLPFLIHWCIIRLRLRGHKPRTDFTLSEEAIAVIAILQGPFKDSESKLFGHICGAGVLIGRRLVLILLYTFVNDTLIRMLCMMMVCFIMLLHHVHVLPYKDTRGNIAGSASTAALLIIGGINLVRAGFEAAEYTPQGPNQFLMYIFEHAENVLMLWIPAAVMGFAILSMTVKICLMVLQKYYSPNT